MPPEPLGDGSVGSLEVTGRAPRSVRYGSWDGDVLEMLLAQRLECGFKQLERAKVGLIPVESRRVVV